MNQYLKVNEVIEVKTGDYRRKWMDAKITSVSLGIVGEDGEERPVYGLSFDVEFLEDGCVQHVSDAFGFLMDEWRYKQSKSHENCFLCGIESFKCEMSTYRKEVGTNKIDGLICADCRNSH